MEISALRPALALRGGGVLGTSWGEGGGMCVSIGSSAMSPSTPARGADGMAEALLDAGETVGQSSAMGESVRPVTMCTVGSNGGTTIIGGSTRGSGTKTSVGMSEFWYASS